MKHGLLIGILFLGLAEFGYGFWIPAKAWLSQYLLQHAWEQGYGQRQQVKPWPWADTWPVFKLTHVASQKSALVLHGDSGQALAFGPGLDAQSHSPGVAGNTIISAHRDTHFSFLSAVKIGQKLVLEDTLGNDYDYKVVALDIVDSRSALLLLNTQEDLLTLVTCYPFNQITAGGPMRYLVTAERTKPGQI